ncbi:hypothetical protein [Rhodoblastus sp.]|uniref:hypothetical protein n=1 Tax=Rhodoblastus sp. TaxID=1962975 RepID=UPI003F969F8B
MRKSIAAAFLIGLLVTPARADEAADHDETPASDCSNLPPEASLPVFSWAETARFCQKASIILEGMRIKDIRTFEKGAVVLSFGHCGTGDLQNSIATLLEIVRLRGQYNQPDRWYGTADLMARICQVYKDAVPPSEIIAFLRSAGPAAKTLSDEGLRNMIIMMEIRHQQGE